MIFHSYLFIQVILSKISMNQDEKDIKKFYPRKRLVLIVVIKCYPDNIL